MEVERANVEENIGEVLEDLRRLMNVGEVVKFTDLLINHTRREIVRVFFALLHLYARMFIEIWEDENGIIQVQLLDPPPEDDEEGLEVQTRLEM
jgi:chromatin segregation and condensation protein Rec8/ScpA/Scc1 (kleisin family)